MTKIPQPSAAAAQAAAGHRLEEIMGSFGRKLAPFIAHAQLSIDAPQASERLPSHIAFGLTELADEWDALEIVVAQREQELSKGIPAIPPVVLHLLASAAFHPKFPCTGLELTHEQAVTCHEFLEAHGFDYFHIHQLSQEQRAAMQAGAQ